MQYINANVGVHVTNVLHKLDEPVYTIYDENWHALEECHQFVISGKASFIYMESEPGKPKRVYLQTDTVVRSIARRGILRWMHCDLKAYGSNHGMYKDPPEPIRMGDNYYTRIDFEGPVAGFYNCIKDPAIWVEARGDYRAMIVG